MAIQEDIQLITNFTGQANDVIPRLCRLYCPSATLAEVVAAGFLDNYLKTSAQTLLTTDFIFGVMSDGFGTFRAMFTNGSCQLVLL